MATIVGVVTELQEMYVTGPGKAPARIRAWVVDKYGECLPLIASDTYDRPGLKAATTDKGYTRLIGKHGPPNDAEIASEWCRYVDEAQP